MSSEINHKKFSFLFVLTRIRNNLSFKNKKKFIFVTLLSIFSSIAESLSLISLIPFFSFLVNPEAYLFNKYLLLIINFFGEVNTEQYLFVTAFLFIFAVLISGFLRILYISSSNKLSEDITSEFRIKIFNFLLNQNYSYFFKYGSNDILSSLAQKTSYFSRIIFSVTNIINAIFISTSIIIVLTFNEPSYTLIIIFSIILFFYLVYRIKSSIILNKAKIISLNQNKFIKIFDNAFGYFQEIILYNLKNFFISKLTQISNESAKYSSETRTISMTPRVYLEVFAITFVIIFIFFFNIIENDEFKTNLTYLAILAYGAQKILQLITSIYHLTINLKAATPMVTDCLDILENSTYQNKQDNTFKITNKIHLKNKLILKNISFQYEKSLKKILNNFSVEIIKGQKIVVKGKSGSGKSTLINIIMGLLDPDDGKILVDDLEIHDGNKKGWQNNISIVPQNVYLNDATILENIAIGFNINDIDRDKVVKVAKICQMHDFVNDLPKKYFEHVGERGIRLSGGQRQRIGIARALYRETDIVILDEPTNSLDFETEKVIIDSILKLDSNLTLIMISHSDRLLEYFDSIINLEKQINN